MPDRFHAKFGPRLNTKSHDIVYLVDPEKRSVSPKECIFRLIAVRQDDAPRIASRMILIQKKNISSGHGRVLALHITTSKI
jgi:hypothetical protein